MVDFDKRSSVKKIGLILLAANTGIGLPGLLGCKTAEVKPGEENIQSILQNYYKRPKGWDRIFGSDLLYWSRYGGRCDFKGHKSAGYGGALDYDVETGTPLVPSTSSLLHKITSGITGGLIIVLRDSVNRDYSTLYSHLYQSLITKKNQENEQGIPTLFERNVIVALSGNSGLGPKDFGGIQRDHLHFGLYHKPLSTEKGEYVDPEEYGPDKGPPIYWDLETDLDMVSSARLMGLERTIKGLPRELESWPQGEHDLGELKGKIFEYHGSIGNATRMEILDSAAFHDMRALLKGEILEKSKTTKYVPGTRPYSLMLKILGYSSIDQNPVVTLPYPSPDLVGLQLEGKLPKNLKPYRLVS